MNSTIQGTSHLATGLELGCQSRRKKSNSFSGEEELRKMPRLWIHAQDTGMQGNMEQSRQGPDVPATPAQHNQQQQHRPNGPVPLSLQAAMALQEIRSSIDKHSLLQQQQQQQPSVVGQPDIKFQLQQQQVSHEQQLKALLDLQQQQMPRNGKVPVHPAEPAFVSPPLMLSPSSGRFASNPLIPSSSSSPSSRLMQAKQFHTEQPRNQTNVWFTSAPAGLDLPAPRAIFPMVSSQFINSMFSLEFPERAIAVSGGLLVEQKQEQQAQCEKLLGGAGSIAIPMQHMPASTYVGQVCTSNNLTNSSNVHLVERTPAPATPPTPPLEGSKDRKKKDSCIHEAEAPAPAPAPVQQQRPQTRTFTKVYKLGSIGRAIDVGRFRNYAELKAELSRMFGLDGQLDQKNGWQLVFVDKENDLLLVGDDPWEEFVNSVRGIRILSPSEVSYYTGDELGGDCLV